MDLGYTIYANTHADFLFKLLRKRVEKSWKCTVRMKNDDILWFVPVNGKQHDPYGWTNTFCEGGNAIREQYTAGPITNEEFVIDLRRVAFNVIDTPYSGRKYVFVGVFDLDLHSNWRAKDRVWRKASDSYDFAPCKY